MLLIIEDGHAIADPSFFKMFSVKFLAGDCAILKKEYPEVINAVRMGV